MLSATGCSANHRGEVEEIRQQCHAEEEEGNHGYFHKAATFAVKHAKLGSSCHRGVGPATYIILAEPSFDMIAAMGDTESIDGMNALSEDFGAGLITPPMS
jgi:hypothetical protein